MEDNKIKQLLKKYSEDACTAQERALLESWYLKQNLAFTLSEDELKEDLKAISQKLPLFKPGRKSSLIPRLAAAAMLMVSLSAGLLYYSGYFSKPVIHQSAQILPGGNKAFLTLSDGRRISLTDATDGNIVGQGDVDIVKTADGELIYTMKSAEGDKNANSYNLMETPKGGEFTVKLPDGTTVRLNAASSLRYPLHFGAKSRIVELTGEGYFEVAKNAAVPFIVKTPKQEIRVLGTHFNVNAYADEEEQKTTLLEGKVVVSTPTQAETLKPGEQSVLKNNVITTATVDTDISVSWKNGQFMFNNESIQGIMRQISRWYNVEVVYEDKLPELKVFGGTISRFENVSEILDVLSLTKIVKFKIEGRRIIVMK